ncbi:His Kinase A (phospho-acceptor) domain protein/HAMP domain protein/Histidine kinase-, DNA gyrase B [Roseovarius mucosus DSM 17069]|uniref:histidine kinase n=1 Tax=Roseovarius mucosus DSM 17069 TaxID=1288298 RepID=A0A0A0HFX0_9RHOB|nr:cache domain-containing protein [Roseovarius mucosus]KGM86667.1 His Kinase A (phospho-acceptor) domain protein/HAMP domain protein/Histidine kinase-, DNA gyrase B [Roseovarius mucosus DSM 17069]
MTSVRLRLLILALLPLAVLMPLLLLVAINRWSANYDNLLITNVASDLRIADQYLQRLLTSTGSEVTSLARSLRFDEVARTAPADLPSFLDQNRRALGLDFLYFMPINEARKRGNDWPVIATATRGQPATEIDIFTPRDLLALPDTGVALAMRARVALVATRAAQPTTRQTEDRGMVVHSATLVTTPGAEGVLVGGLLLNRNLDFIDTINALVYRDTGRAGDRQGTATLFLEDVRISTNVRLFAGERALGTRVSAAVRSIVLEQGQTWLDSAFVVNDWYISAYRPLTDSFGKRVGMLYVGFLQAPFDAAKRRAYLLVLAAFLVVLAVSAPLFLRLARNIFAPLERMTRTMEEVEAGDMTARIGPVAARDEIGTVAAHLDTLLDQVQERDRALRAWNEDLNARVETRTAELREANAKLETTYQQLVMSEKLASIGEITAGVAHEINNPAAVIQGNLDVIRQTLGAQSEPVKTELDLIDRQIGRITAIVGKLLQFARPGDFGTFEEDVDLAAVLRDCLVLVDHVVTKAGHQVTLDTQADTPPVRINPGELQQVIINLVTNAAQAMQTEGHLTLTTRPALRDGHPGAVLIVADTGPGIPKDELSLVFDPFFTTKQGEGTGLGLSVSQTLIQQAGGRITARNRAEGGAEFTVWLPAQTL